MDELEDGELRNHILSEWNKMKDKLLQTAISASKTSFASKIIFPLFIDGVFDSVEFDIKSSRFTGISVGIGKDG